MKSRKDENLVLFSRIVVLAVLLLVAISIATLTYMLVAEDEKSNFKAQVRYAWAGVTLRLLHATRGYRCR